VVAKLEDQMLKERLTRLITMCTCDIYQIEQLSAHQ